MNGDVVAAALGIAALAVYIFSDIYTRRIRENARREMIESSAERSSKDVD